MSFPEGIRSDVIEVAAFEGDNAYAVQLLVNDWLKERVKGVLDIIPLSGKPSVIIVYRAGPAG